MPMGNSPYGGMLDPQLVAYMKRQQLVTTLGNIGRGLMQAGARGADFGPGLLTGLGQGGGAGGGQNNLLNMIRIQELLGRAKDRQTARERERKQTFARDALTAGDRYDPATRILWDRPPAAGQEQPGATPEQHQNLLAEAYPEAVGQARVAQALPKPLAPDRQLVEVYDPNSPTGTRMVPRIEAAGQPGTPPSSLMQITGYDAAGRPLIQVGGGAGVGEMQKKTRGDIEKTLFGAQEGLARLSDVEARFRPEYQEIGTRWDAFKASWLEKAGVDIAPADQQLLRDFTAYKRDSIDNINRYIKEITGAQMSEAEAGRLTKGMPNPGTGIFDGDSPTEFISKLKATTASLRKASARYVYALRNGLDPQSIPLDRMEKNHAGSHA